MLSFILGQEIEGEIGSLYDIKIPYVHYFKEPGQIFAWKALYSHERKTIL